ncbi:MAG: glycosyltransferase family A protein [Crocosphaera sp.]|nr:glycosyltransferase family A protein [Crocosphaera sp.]
MLTFIIPLKSPEVSSDWERVLKLFTRTLKSVCNQTIPHFRVIVISNVIPEIDFQHPNVKYIKVNFCPIHKKTVVDKDADKGHRILIGLIEAKKNGSDYVMVVDADDCISQSIAEFVDQNANEEHSGWFIDYGYVYQESSKFIYLRNYKFNKICGTGNIIRLDKIDLPKEADNHGQQTYLHYGNHQHFHVRKKILKNVEKYPYLPLPFFGAIYNIGNQENIYQTGFDKLHQDNYKSVFFRLKEMRHYRLLTRKIREEFNLFPLD